jgi:DNA polymerase-3 subunit alpha
MVAIKGVGESIVEAIIAEREASGPFTHLYEFCERTKAAGINRTAVEALIRAGALDSIDPNRNKLLNHVDGALQFAEIQHRAKLAGQDSLFGEADAAQGVSHFPALPECDRPTRSENLAMEKEVMGIYVSDHPLRGHERTISQNSSHTCAAALEADESVFVRLAGVIAKMKTIVTKAEGKRMASLTLEDFSGQIGMTVFPATFEKLRDVLQKDSVVQVAGYISHREMRGEKQVEVRVEDVKPLEGSLEIGFDGPSQAAGTVTITVRRATSTQIAELKSLVDEHPGDYQVIVQVASGNVSIPVYLVQHVNPTETFVKAVKKGLTSGEIEVEHAFA